MITGLLIASGTILLAAGSAYLYKNRKRKQKITLTWRDSDGNVQTEEKTIKYDKKDVPYSDAELKAARKKVAEAVKTGKLELGSTLERMNTETPKVERKVKRTRPSFAKKSVQDREVDKKLQKRDIRGDIDG